jgi:probable phosphoglycerate mutase
VTSRSLELFFVRHGESVWNLDGRIQGQSAAAPGLTPTGARQAIAAAVALEGCGAELVITSDLLRAVQTATPIAARLGLGVRLDPRLRERAFGAAEGLPVEAVERELGVEHGVVVDADARPEGGESVRELYERVGELIDSLRSGELHSLVLVSHGGVVRVARALLGGEPPDEMPWRDVGNASVWPVSVR